MGKEINILLGDTCESQSEEIVMNDSYIADLNVEYDAKSKELQKLDQNHEQFEIKMAAVNGSLSRIATQLRLTENKKTEVDAENCGEVLTNIGLKLERLLTILIPKNESENDPIK